MIEEGTQQMLESHNFWEDVFSFRNSVDLAAHDNEWMEDYELLASASGDRFWFPLACMQIDLCPFCMDLQHAITDHELQLECEEKEVESETEKYYVYHSKHDVYWTKNYFVEYCCSHAII